MSETRKNLGNGRELVQLTDGDQVITAIEKIQGQLTDDPSQFPKLTAAHLMGGEKDPEQDTGTGTMLDTLMPRRTRAYFVALGMLKRLSDANPILLAEMHELGRDGWVRKMKEVERKDSLACGLSTADYEYAWEVFDYKVRQIAKAGATFRKRKDWRG